jgi:hypothetical protein
MARLSDKVQYALDEARLLILGSQVLLGLQYRSVFESGFDRLPAHAKYMKLIGLFSLLIAFVLLVWPGAYHRVVSRGVDTPDVHNFTTRVMEVALLPFAFALGLELFIAAEKTAGTVAGIVAGVSAGLLSLTFWYGIEMFAARTRGSNASDNPPSNEDSVGSKLKNKIEHVLTETRVVLPGAQALFGFQLVTILMEAFDALPELAKYVHLASLGSIAISVILLMTPAAHHRIVEKGEETEGFHRFASRTLLAAMVPLALGICGDLFVVTWKVTQSFEFGVISSAAMLVLFFSVWFGLPGYWRRSKTSAKRWPEQRDASAAQH